MGHQALAGPWRGWTLLPPPSRRPCARRLSDNLASTTPRQRPEKRRIGEISATQGDSPLEVNIVRVGRKRKRAELGKRSHRGVTCRSGGAAPADFRRNPLVDRGRSPGGTARKMLEAKGKAHARRSAASKKMKGQLGARLSARMSVCAEKCLPVERSSPSKNYPHASRAHA